MSRPGRTLVLAVIALAPAVPARALAGACARPEIPTVALTATGAELAKGGGVVVSLEDTAKAPTWKFVRGKQTVAAKPRVIGAGLVAYDPPATGAWTLQDAKARPVLDVTRATVEVKPLAAPKVVSIKRASFTSRRGTSVYITVEVTGTTPTGAVALVVLDAKGAVRSWGKAMATPAAARSSAYQVFAQGGCMVYPNGFADSAAGDKVSIAWLDGSGRLSPATAATVVEPPAPKTTSAPGLPGD